MITSEQLNTRGLQYLNAKDYISAVNYFVEAVRLDGNLNATYNLGFCLFHGYGIEKNYLKALGFFNCFKNLKGDVANNAMYLSGVIYNNGGYGIDKDINMAKSFYLKAANNGHAWSLLELGRLMIYDKDYQTAKKYIKTAMQAAPNDYLLQKEGKKFLRLNTIMDLL